MANWKGRIHSLLYRTAFDAKKTESLLMSHASQTVFDLLVETEIVTLESRPLFLWLQHLSTNVLLGNLHTTTKVP